MSGYVTSQGEDSPVKGRLLLYELDCSHTAIDTAGGTQHRHLPKLKQVQEKVMAGTAHYRSIPVDILHDLTHASTIP